jgi:hypothetical protein
MTFQPGDIVEYVEKGAFANETRVVLKQIGEEVWFVFGEWANANRLRLVTPATPALVPKFAVGDEVKTTFGDLRTVKEIVISYRVSNGGFWIEEMLSPVCSHTHTTCDECHERIER